MKLKFFILIAFAILISAILIAYFVLSPIIKIENDKVGDLAKDFLKDNYAHVLIEIDYVKGYSADDSSLSTLEERVKTYTKKTVSIKKDDEFAKEKDTYSIEDIINLEKKHRNNFNKEKTIVLYIIYLNGEYKEENVLGIAYSSSSFAIFKEKINNIKIPLWARLLGVDNSDFEKSVLVHEFGHILALVNINYKSDFDHEDKENPNHCKNESCVMYYAIESSPESYISNYINTGNPEPPNDYCNYCKNDLEKIRSS